MKKRILTLALALVLLVALAIPASVALAAETGVVNCTVSGKLISLTVTDGDVAYGILDMSATKNTALYDDPNNLLGLVTAQTQAIENTGTVAEDFNMKTTFADGATVDWTLHVDTPGVNVFTHAYLVSDTAYDGSAAIGSFTNWAAVDTYVPNAGGTAVAASDIKYLELEIGMPTGTTDYGAHTITVTVQATES